MTEHERETMRWFQNAGIGCEWIGFEKTEAGLLEYLRFKSIYGAEDGPVQHGK